MKTKRNRQTCQVEPITELPAMLSNELSKNLRLYTEAIGISGGVECVAILIAAVTGMLQV